jgi:hypothetical protein
MLLQSPPIASPTGDSAVQHFSDQHRVEGILAPLTVLIRMAEFAKTSANLWFWDKELT